MEAALGKRRPWEKGGLGKDSAFAFLRRAKFCAKVHSHCGRVVGYGRSGGSKGEPRRACGRNGEYESGREGNKGRGEPEGRLM